MEVKGASRKTVSSSRRFQTPSPSPSRSRLARPEFVPPTPPYLQPPPPKDRPFRSLDANISAKMGTYLILWLINSRVGRWRGSRDIYFVGGERERTLWNARRFGRIYFLYPSALCPSGSPFVSYIYIYI